MPRPRRPHADRDVVVDLVDELLLDHPETPEGVHEALAGFDRETIAAVVVDVVTTDRVRPFDDDLLTEIARAAAPRAVVDGLLAVAADTDAPIVRRAIAWSAALSVDVARAQRAPIDPAVMVAAHARSIRVTLLGVEMDPERFCAQLRDTLLALDAPHRELWWASAELIRAEHGIPAGLTYRDVLAHPALRDRAEALDALLDAAPDAHAVAAVERALTRAPNPSERAHLERRLMALRTAAIERPPPRPSARVWASGCDGQGAYLLHAEIERPGGGVLGGQICLRVAAQLRSSWVDAVGDADHQRMRDEMEVAVGPWHPIEPSAAAALVMRAVEQAHRVPPDLQAGVALFRRLHRPGDAPPAVAAAGAATCADIEAHLGMPPGDAWYLDDRDLRTLALDRPPEADRDRQMAWTQRARRALVEHDVHLRWAAMAEQLAWWLALDDDAESAARMASAARATRRDPHGSPLVHALLDHTITAHAREAEPLPDLSWLEDDDDDPWGAPPPGWRYDGHVAPDPEIWLSLDEMERVEAVVVWHMSPDGPGAFRQREDAFRHALLQAVVETQLCLADPPHIRPAIARLEREGFDRFRAVLGVQLVLASFLGRPDMAGAYNRAVTEIAGGGRAALDALLGHRSGRPDKTTKRRRTPRKTGGRKKLGRTKARKRRR